MIFNYIGKFCKYFRKEILNLTLIEMSKKVNVKTNTLSSFENGRSTNYNHLIKYYRCGNDEQKAFFRENLPLWKGCKMEKNELTELKEYLIENNFPQSFIDLIEDLSINDLLTIIEK